ncbi:unnamed protein product [Cuscuta epithymum]|uniref:Uncharacterized protein n=1 Tax=Cuscuta epithymum TaxID=186058 RepID=A0AAV0DUL0_9ASTE|nr:unnamed protein product [Cuscuta epithymum]
MLRLLSTLTAAKNEYTSHNLSQKLLESCHFTNDQLLFQKLWQENQAALMNNLTTSTCPTSSNNTQPMNTAAATTSPVELNNIGHENTIKSAAQCTLTYPRGEYPGNPLPRLEHVTSRSPDNTLTFDHQNTMMQENLVPSSDFFTSPESYGSFGVGLGNDEPLTEMCNHNSQRSSRFDYSSVLPTPLSSPGTATFVNGDGCTEEKKERHYYTNMMEFFENSSCFDV